MEQRVVVGVDGADPSWLAVDWAADEAARHECALHIVHASRWERYENFASVGLDRPAARVLAENFVATAERRAALRQPDLKVTAETKLEDPVEALVAEGRSAFAVVVGTRGHGTVAGAFLGSVSLGVAARASCPTIVVRAPERNRTGQREIVVLGVDEGVGSPAVSFAFREAETRGADLHAVHAWRLSNYVPSDSPDSEAMAYEANARVSDMLSDESARHPKVPMHHEATEGSAQHVLLHAAESADLLVVGAHAHRGAHGLGLGLISHAVLHRAPCTVAVVPHV